MLDLGGTVSVQVLNEFAAVARRKAGLSWPEVREVLGAVRASCATRAVTEETHDLGLDIAERYGFSLYDSMVVAAAQAARCTAMYSEDLQHRQVIDGTLTIRNPFVGGR